MRPERTPAACLSRLAAAAVPALLAACLPTRQTPPPTLSPSPPPPPTATTVAFPTLIPTSTWTPAASATPTADPQFGLGGLLLSDPFDDAAAWDLPISSTSGASIQRGRLTLAVSAPREYHWSLRSEPTAADFYATVDVLAEVCNPGDEFGLVARANSLGEQYRFMLGCDGTARITRRLETGSRGLTLAVASPSIIAGAPSLNRLAVRVRGLDLALFVNGQELVAARDAALSFGRFGVIVRAGPSGQVSVGFDNLVVYELSDGRATPTAPPP